MPDLIFGADVPTSTHADAVAAAQHAETLGFDFVSASDHPHSTATHETLTMLTWIAAHTSRIRLVTRVLGVPFRRPAMVAKTAASLDLLTGGRFVLGLGAGHSDEEIRALGGSVPSAREKVDNLADAVRIIRDAHNLEIWLGTFGPRALAVTGQLADGWIPSHSHAPPEAIPVLRKRIDVAAEAAGRDPAAIRGIYNVVVRVESGAASGPGLVAGTATQVADELRSFVDLGFTGFNIMATGDQLERIAGEVLPVLR